MKRTGRIVITLVTALLLVFTAACTPTPSSTPTWANTTPRTVTKVVAASNANTDWKAQADYVCDGIADDLEINAAIAALPTGGGEVKLSDGTFTISATIVFNKSNMTVSGQGNGTIVKIVDQNNTDFECFWYDPYFPVSNVMVRDLAIDGNKANQAAGRMQGINWQNMTHFGIFNVYIYDIRGFGIYSNNSTGGIIKNNVIVNCSITGIYLAAGANQNEVEGNMVKTDTSDARGIRIVDSEDNTIAHNQLIAPLATSGVGIYSDGAGSSSGNRYLGNYISGWGFGIFHRQGGGASVADQLIISGNTINSAGQWSGISLNYCGYALITSNKIYNCKRHGIYIYGCDYSVISGNEIIGNSQQTDNLFDAINVESCNYCVITGNSVHHGGGAKWHRYNVNLDASSTHNRVSDNNFAQGANSLLLDSGTNNDIYRQHSDMFMDVLATSSTGIRSNEDLSVAIPIAFSLDAQADVPRNLTWSFDSHANITAYSMTVTGVDAKGRTQTETWTQAVGWSGTLNVAYAKITSIVMTAKIGTGVGDTMDIGTGSKLGLSNLIEATTSVFKVKRNSADYPAASYTVDATYDTVDVSTGGVIVGGDCFTIWYKVNLNTTS